MAWVEAWGSYSKNGAQYDVMMVGSGAKSSRGLDLTKAKQAGHGRGIQFTPLNNQGTSVKIDLSLIGMSSLNGVWSKNNATGYASPGGGYKTSGYTYKWFVDMYVSTNNGASYSALRTKIQVASHSTPMALAYNTNTSVKPWRDANIEWSTTVTLPSNYTHLKFEVRGEDPAQRHQNIYTRQIIAPPKRQAKVTVVHRSTSGEKLGESVINGYEGDSYTTQKGTFSGYNFAYVSGSANGTMIISDYTVTYYYEKIPEKGTITIEYIGNNGVSLGKDTITGDEGTQYNITAKEFPNYTYARSDNPLTGVIPKDGLVVKLYYNQNTSPITVSYYDTKGNQLQPNRTYNTPVGNDYDIEIPPIEGYTYINSSVPTEGVMPDKELLVRLNYKKDREPDKARDKEPLEPIVKTIVEEIPPVNPEDSYKIGWGINDCVLCDCVILDTETKVITTTIKTHEIRVQGFFDFEPQTNHRISITDLGKQLEPVDVWVSFEEGDRINIPIDKPIQDYVFNPDGEGKHKLEFIYRGRVTSEGKLLITVDDVTKEYTYKPNITTESVTTLKNDPCDILKQANEYKIRDLAIVYRDLQTCNLAEYGAKGFYNVWCMFENIIKQICILNSQVTQATGGAIPIDESRFVPVKDYEALLARVEALEEANNPDVVDDEV